MVFNNSMRHDVCTRVLLNTFLGGQDFPHFILFGGGVLFFGVI